MGPQLILSGSQSERLQAADQIINPIFKVVSIRSKGHPDLILLEAENSLGINQVRSLQKQLALKPYSAPQKVALITRAEKLTLPAQNALLKTLEEPPAKTLIILLAPQKEALLPTIISRCQITQLSQKPQIEIKQEEITQTLETLTAVLKARAGERLKLAQSFTYRPKALTLAKNLLWLWREILLIKAGSKKGRLPGTEGLDLQKIKKALQETEISRAMLEANVNPRLALENLFLSYPKLSPPR